MILGRLDNNYMVARTSLSKAFFALNRSQRIFNLHTVIPNIEIKSWVDYLVLIYP